MHCSSVSLSPASFNHFDIIYSPFVCVICTEFSHRVSSIAFPFSSLSSSNSSLFFYKHTRFYSTEVINITLVLISLCGYQSVRIVLYTSISLFSIILTTFSSVHIHSFRTKVSPILCSCHSFRSSYSL